MFEENLKKLRKEKGLSQQEVALRLHVVRQTVSKWEQGLSVPDADLLVKLADVLEIDVSHLLCGEADRRESRGQEEALVEQLVELNRQLAEKTRRGRRIWKAVGIAVALFLLFYVLLVVLGSVEIILRRWKNASQLSVPKTDFWLCLYGCRNIISEAGGFSCGAQPGGSGKKPGAARQNSGQGERAIPCFTGCEELLSIPLL